LAYLSAGAVAGTTAVYRNDLKQLEFDAVSALGPLLRLLDAEQAHKVGVWAASKGLFPKETRGNDSSLSVTVWGKTFANPIGLAAGFDKDGEAIPGMLGLGFGFVEIGSVTPLPQPGNPQPRCFRLKEFGAVINRYGFNSAGVQKVKENLQIARNKLQGESGKIGVNLGKNKLSDDAVGDYSIGVRELGPFADYLVINISSPNTPGLRALQSRKELEALVSAVLKERNILCSSQQKIPLLVKIAPDLVQEDLEDIAKVALKLGVDGLIVSNTTIERPDTIRHHMHAGEMGGLSGKPLFVMSTAVLHEMYRLTKGKIPLVGVGGVSSGKDAYLKIRAGASLVELYTSLVYDGPALIPRIKKDLAACLKADGFSSIQEAIGADHDFKVRK
jgi:dihydroorotate dehydrogenase